MRAMLTTAVLVACAAATVTAADEKKFESKEGKYTAKFPGEPKTISQKAGGLDLSITILEKEKEKVGYAVIYSDMAADVVKAAPPSKLLENGQKGLEADFKAKITKSTDVKVKAGGKEYPGKEITAEKEDKHMRITLVLVDARLYQVFVIGTKESVAGAEAEAFLKSFEVVKP